MIESITGRIVYLQHDHLVIETGGIAYRIFCPSRTLALSRPGEEREIYVHLIIRDDSLSLFGFPTREERELFRNLLTIPQVGPKLALQLLSALTPAAFSETVRDNDVERLISVKGVGRKTAQRILVELHDKIGPAVSSVDHVLPLSEKEETALRALTSKSLGFSAREARQAIERLRGEDLPTEQLIRRALEIIGSS
jgi:Holliday junction DNA helicase RuvA